MDTIKAPPQDSDEKGQREHGIVATLCDENRFHLVFDQLLDADMQPEVGDFTLFVSEQQLVLESLSLTNGTRNGEPWSIISFNLASGIEPGSQVQLNYHPRQFFLWSEDLDAPIEGFELQSVTADVSSLKDIELKASESIQLKESESGKIKADARIVEASERQIRIVIKQDLEVGLEPKSQDFRAESDSRKLSIDKVYLSRATEGTELSLFLREVIEANCRVKASYKAGRGALRTPGGEPLDSFELEAVASTQLSGSPGEADQSKYALADIDQLLDIPPTEDGKSGDDSNVVPLFADSKELEADIGSPSGETLEDGRTSGESGVEKSAEVAAAAEVKPEQEPVKVEQEVSSLATEEPPAPNEPSVQGLVDNPVLMNKPRVKPSKSVDPEKVVITSLADGSAQSVDPQDAFGTKEEDEAEEEAVIEYSFVDSLKQAGLPVKVAVASGVALVVWGLFALINFSTLLIGLGFEKPEPLQVERLAPTKAAVRVSCDKTYENGASFKGTCLEGKRDGGGNYNYGNGDSYSGEWQQDLRHGSGMMKKGNGEIYAGSFANDKMHGRGSFRWPDGRVYEGEFVDDQFHGEGMLQETDGRQFKGRFENGEPIDGKCITQEGSETPGPCS